MHQHCRATAPRWLAGRQRSRSGCFTSAARTAYLLTYSLACLLTSAAFTTKQRAKLGCQPRQKPPTPDPPYTVRTIERIDGGLSPLCACICVLTTSVGFIVMIARPPEAPPASTRCPNEISSVRTLPAIALRTGSYSTNVKPVYEIWRTLRDRARREQVAAGDDQRFEPAVRSVAAHRAGWKPRHSAAAPSSTPIRYMP